MHPENQAVVYIWSPWKVVEYDLGKREITGAAWEFGKGARNRVVKTWLVPSSCYLSDCFADDDLFKGLTTTTAAQSSLIRHYIPHTKSASAPRPLKSKLSRVVSKNPTTLTLQIGL
ncbi:hypothetical protein TRIUR3_17020 [Triticum urartu]|uniref:Uncharacterized protein n=1 Tax=Triticum urartu TaxID=4572 RepID=M7Z6K4_TRIUA|nr:hypothetical protein TRIUR3_17020 [Triticum urartu]